MREPACVELVFDPTCPNVERARGAIRTALRAYGSRTVLVNGADVSGGDEAANADANSCRVYLDECGCICGAPSVEQIVSAIESTRAAT